MTESIIQPKPFPKDFYVFDIIVIKIDWNISSMSLSLIIIFAFELEYKLSYFVLPSLSIFLNSETNVVKNLEPFNWANNSISLFLIADSVSSSCSSELKEFKISTFSTYISFKSTFSFCYFCIFLFRKCSRFFVSLYKEQLESTFSACFC